MASNKLALITGASGGIGSAAVDFLSEDYHVIGTSRSQTTIEKMQADWQSRQINAQAQMLDISDANSVASLEKYCRENGMPDVLVCNAGVNQDNLFLRMDWEQWHNVIDTNLNGLYRLCKAFLKPMVKKRWGRIIVVTSLVGAAGNAGQANYAAAKAGMTGFVKSLAIEVASRGITVNCVAPGFIETAMSQEVLSSHQEKILAEIPMKHIGQPADVASAIAFLASDAAGYITGQTLHVNGGMYRG